MINDWLQKMTHLYRTIEIALAAMIAVLLLAPATQAWAQGSNHTNRAPRPPTPTPVITNLPQVNTPGAGGVLSNIRELVGKSVMIYPQQDVVRDLVAVRLGYGAPLLFEVSAVSVGDIDQARLMIRFKEKGEPRTIECDYIAGCDGFHGISRPSIPAGKIKLFERDYPFAWLGILAEAPPTKDELVYTHHEAWG